MKRKIGRVIVLVLVCAAFGTAVKISAQCCGPVKEVQKVDGATVKAQEMPKAEDKAETASVRLPRMLELGSVKCKACKAMEPVMEELRKNHSGEFAVEFIDVMQNPQVGEKYALETIPTQIFLDSDGKELFRHSGFFSKDDILSKWKELGYDLGNK